MKVNVITLCSGYDSQCMGLERLKENFPGFDFELTAWAEFDPDSKLPIERQPAVVAHNLAFPEYADRNVGDMTKVDWTPFVGKCDLLTYSTPCQSVSSAGKMAGIEEGSGTRSSILWYTEEAVRILKPKFLLQENVKNLVSNRFRPDFEKWCQRLESYNYKNFWKVLNAKDYGVPQNRERVFMVSILRTEDDPDPQYCFPTPFELTRSMKDVLEEDVDEKFYLNQSQVDLFLANNAVKKHQR